MFYDTSMQFKKIGLFSAHSFAKPGGVQNHVIALYKEFTQRGIAAKIIAPAHGQCAPFCVPEKDFIPIGISAYVPANQSKAEFSLSVRRSSRQKILEENFDILHFHNLGLGPLSYQLLRHAKSINILTIHAADDGSVIAKIPILKRFVHGVYEKKFHGVIGVSPAAIETIQNFGGFRNGPLELIPNGIDLLRFREKHVGRAKLRTTLLFVGRFEKRKGLLYLLRSLKILTAKHGRKLRLVIVGEGEQRKSAQDYITKHDLQAHVAFAGSVSNEILLALYQSADIFCAPSLRGESFGITLLEAMACGIPVAGFANKGYRYVMQGHEQACGANLLASAGNSPALAEKIALLIHNNDVYERAKSWGLERVKQFAWPKIADRILHFYEEACKCRVSKDTSIHWM